MSNHHLHHLVKCFLYAMVADPEDSSAIRYFKIGISYDMIPRIASVQTGCPMAIKNILCALIPSRLKALKAESDLHRLLSDYNTSGEWFRFDMEDKSHKKAFRGATGQVLDPILGAGWKWEVIKRSEIKDEMTYRSAIKPRYATGTDLVMHAYKMANGLPMW